MGIYKGGFKQTKVRGIEHDTFNQDHGRSTGAARVDQQPSGGHHKCKHQPSCADTWKIDGLHPNTFKKLIVDDMTSIFRGGMAVQDGTFWRIDRANEPQREQSFAFINQMFEFEQSPLALSYEMLVMAVAA